MDLARWVKPVLSQLPLLHPSPVPRLALLKLVLVCKWHPGGSADSKKHQLDPIQI
ncbi:MAG: hypothetical protein L0K07_12075 [Yaniella sp.]|nr:hypothetical protein [Yaniella sp.]